MASRPQRQAPSCSAVPCYASISMFVHDARSAAVPLSPLPRCPHTQPWLLGLLPLLRPRRPPGRVTAAACHDGELCLPTLSLEPLLVGGVWGVRREKSGGADHDSRPRLPEVIGFNRVRAHLHGTSSRARSLVGQSRTAQDAQG